jgi:hypothetical protein
MCIHLARSLLVPSFPLTLGATVLTLDGPDMLLVAKLNSQELLIKEDFKFSLSRSRHILLQSLLCDI